MTGISYTVTLEEEYARQRLDVLLDRMDRPRGFFRNVGEHLLNSAADNFEHERDPDGIPWQRLMPKTIERRERRRLTPIRILRARGRLSGSLNVVATDEEARIGSPMPYAAIHQLGGTIKVPERTGMIHQHYDAKTDTFDPKFRKKSRANFSREVTIKAHTIDMPKRSYLGVSKDDEVAIIRIAREWLGDE